jgi:hypothetical protein
MDYGKGKKECSRGSLGEGRRDGGVWGRAVKLLFPTSFWCRGKKMQGSVFFSLGGLQNVARLAKMGQEPF